LKFGKWLILIAVVAGLTLGVLRALKSRKDTQAQAALAAEALLVPPTFELDASDVYTVGSVNLTQTVAVTGTVIAPQSATVKSAVAGDIVEWRVREGDTVEAGEVLGRIDSADLQARLHQAEQQALALRANVATTRRQYDNNQALAQQGFISPAALQASKDSWVGAQANAAGAQVNVNIARKALQDSTVRAPFGGQISQRMVQRGDRVAVNTPLAQITDARTLELEVALPVAELRRIKLGQSARLNAQAMTETIEASVVRISPNLAAGNRSASVYLSLPAAAGLRSGEFLQGDLQVGQVQSLAVPSTAVHHEKPEPYIQVLTNGRVQHREIEVGAQGHIGDEGWVAIPSGLQAGEQVLRLSSGVLPDGTQATLRPSAAVK
jgi:membrane fusion protein, multidrug efflux system